MATPFTEIYSVFLSKVTDYNFVDTDIYPTEEELYEDLYGYLRSALVRFKQSKIDLTNRTSTGFSETLSDDEIEILASLMLIGYLNPKIVSTQNMDMYMSDTEYKMYSQGKQLEEMIKLKKTLQKEVSQLISSYTYSDGITSLQ